MTSGPTSASPSAPLAETLERIMDTSDVGPHVYSPPPFMQSMSSDGRSGSDDAEEDQDDVDDQSISPDLYRIAAVAGLGGLLFGFDTGVVSGALLSLSQDPTPLAPLSTSQESFLVTSALIGALSSSLFAGRLADSDRLGRKGVVVVAAVLFSIGAAEMAAAQVYKEIILGRVLIGFGVGLASCVLPTYLAELSPPKYRGRIVASLVVLITGGQVVAYVVDALCLHFMSQQPWRWMFGFGILPAVLQLVLSFSLPESPRYLFRKGKNARGRQVVKRLNPTWTPGRVQKEVEKLMAEVGNPSGSQSRERLNTEREGSHDWHQRWRYKVSGVRRIDWKEKKIQWSRRRDQYTQLVWSDRGNRKALIVACGLQLFQQTTGFNCLMYYSTKVIQQTHLSSPATFALLIAISNFFCTLLALRIVDRTGRRTLLLRGLVGMTIGMVVLSISFGFISDSAPLNVEGEVGEPRAGAAAVVSLIGMTGFCCAYALSLGNVPWIVQAEVFVPELKAVGTGLATSVNWAGNILVSATFLHVSEGIGPSGAFALFGGICAVGFFFTYLLLPETKGLSLGEIRHLFENHSARGTEVGPKGSETEETGRDGGGYHVIAEDGDTGDDGGETSGESDGENERRRTRIV